MNELCATEWNDDVSGSARRDRKMNKCVIKAPQQQHEVFHNCVSKLTTEDGESAPKVPRVELPASLPMNDHQDVEQQYGDAETESDHHDQSVLLDDCVPSTSTTESCN